jgi:Carboxypeptidase regulatory-like domain
MGDAAGRKSVHVKEAEMNRDKKVLLSALAVAGMIAAVPALGMGMAGDAMKAPNESNLPAEQVQGKVTFMSGGIGSDEAAAMRKEEAKYPLSLEFVGHGRAGGEHLAGVNVTIEDTKGGTDLTTVSSGPYLLVKLPAGDYKVTADHDGRTKTRNVVIAANKPERVVFEW